MKRVLSIASLLILSCQSAPPPLGVPAGCQPLLPGTDCLLPWPSDFFRVVDARQPSGFRIEHQAAARLTTKQGGLADPTWAKAEDGFSTVPTIVALLQAPTAPTGFVSINDAVDDSLKSSSNSLLIEADTNTLMPHFVDLDPRAIDPSRQAIVLHVRDVLKPRTRYVVVLHGVKGPDGELVKAPEGFRRLRDNAISSDLTELSKGYEARIFPVVKAVGVPRAEVQLAWEFTTGSTEWAQRDLLKVRELTMAWLQANTPTVTVSNTDDPAGTDIYRVVHGTITGPKFVDTPEPGAKLTRDANGDVVQSGTVEFAFTAVIPNVVAADTVPAKAFVFGHGFFGILGQIEMSPERNLAVATHRVAVAIEWWGMNIGDAGKIADALTGHPSVAADFVDRVHQAMANHLVTTKAVASFGQLPAFQHGAAQPMVEGEGDAFIGISQGSILGGTMVAVNPYVKRAVLEVGGAGFTLMMMRARPFSVYFDLMVSTVSDPLEQQKYVALLQRPLDRIDPATWAPMVLKEPLPNSAPKQVLFQMGVADTQVPNVASFLYARRLGVPLLQPAPVAPWGVEVASGTAPLSSGMSIYDFKVGSAAELNRLADFPPSENIVHATLRENVKVLEQIDTFFRDGVVKQTCDGVCDPL